VNNIISHPSKSELTEDKFNQLWQKTTNALIALGVARMEMEKIRTMDFTAMTNAHSETEQIKTNVAFSAGSAASGFVHFESLTIDNQDTESKRSLLRFVSIHI